MIKIIAVIIAFIISALILKTVFADAISVFMDLPAEAKIDVIIKTTVTIVTILAGLAFLGFIVVMF